MSSEQINVKALERAISVDTTKPLMKPERPDKSFAPPNADGIHQLLAAAQETLEESLSTIRKISERLQTFDNMQNRFYRGEKS